MLELDETLFVEHKHDVRDESSYHLARSVASFANTIGGWLLIGVRERLSRSPWNFAVAIR